MTRDEAIKLAEQAYPKEFLDFGDGRSDNRSECKMLVDRLVLLGLLQLDICHASPGENGGGG
jgi:hypothetical protein